jgi:hypothetical protein
MKDQLENPKGLHQRYAIKKIVVMATQPPTVETLEEQDVDPDAEYFVLRLDLGGRDIHHIKAGRIAIHAYAEAIKDYIPQLASDLRERYPLL